MKKLIPLLIFVLFGACLITNGYAARNITLPYSTDFNTNDISDLIWAQCGGTVTYSNEGWSGGAVKITPPTSACASGNGGMSSIGYFNFPAVNQLNIRFLMKVGPTYVTSHRGYNQNKFIDVRTSNDRAGILTLEYSTANGEFYTPGVYPEPSNWTVFRSPGTAQSDHFHENSPFKIHDGGTYSNTWICYEYQINRASNTATVTITQTDGTITIIYSSESNPSGSMVAFVLGGYHNGYSVANAGNWLLIDNIAVSATGVIGPPEGFVAGRGSDGTAAPSAPGGLTIISGQ